jgi:hypothetical protein
VDCLFCNLVVRKGIRKRKINDPDMKLQQERRTKLLFKCTVVRQLVSMAVNQGGGCGCN